MNIRIALLYAVTAAGLWPQSTSTRRSSEPCAIRAVWPYRSPRPISEIRPPLVDGLRFQPLGIRLGRLHHQYEQAALTLLAESRIGAALFDAVSVRRWPYDESQRLARFIAAPPEPQFHAAFQGSSTGTNLGVDNIRGPRIRQFDAGLSRVFLIRERQAVEFSTRDVQRVQPAETGQSGSNTEQPHL